ncbi:hypothetical protein G7Y89_g11078 [Cudoniella acicularis]|uniref:Heterokaryon incompatibility domain-containing protein n=1 Tax=Cudoniella acicularis TaxID=354080 RepID=A0A8H4RDT4_9HELO|nr:hypothetical protein G7Y89_g11078 [Cudoniella acicularis]
MMARFEDAAVTAAFDPMYEIRKPMNVNKVPMRRQKVALFVGRKQTCRLVILLLLATNYSSILVISSITQFSRSAKNSTREMSWTDQNELMRLGKKILDATGTNTPSEKSMISQLASSAGVGYHVARDAYVKSVLDPLLQEKVRKSMNWLIHATFVPEFVDGKASNANLDDSTEAFDPSSIKPDGLQTPKRMFNIDTGNLEDWPTGQYVILSHSWKGQEISYPFISNLKESRKKREVYEMMHDDSDEEARRFARFKAKKFKHLEAGKSDVQLLSAQCTKDIQAQIKKIDTVLSRSGTNSNARELLAQLAEFKEATWGEMTARNSCNAKKKELELRKMADNVLEKEKKDAGVDDSEMPSGMNEKDDLGKEFAQAEQELSQAEEKLGQAEERLRKATASCEVMNHDSALSLAVEDLLPVLERKKSMNKIEGSIREAKRILDSGLFPSNGRKRYLWNDTCCIDKSDANELTGSLAMMGEWYNNADFCLVHLDTPSSTEWVSTWDHLEQPAELPNFCSFDCVSDPKWATRGWTLQELVLSKMSFYVNSLWQPLARSVEGLGAYYYHCSYLDKHIQDGDILNVPPEAKSILQDTAILRELMDTGEKIEYISYPGCSEKSRRLIGILDFLGVHFPGDMDDDNSSAYIRNAISVAAYGIESRLNRGTSAGQRLRNLFTALGFDTTSIRAQARSLIKLLVRALIEDCTGAIDEDRKRVSQFTHVSPPECCRGLSRSSLPAYDILSLASYRECTVPVDRVYSLMGVLGVKFAAFHAEGPTKALCRLLDEVVITTNDVSIFNWAGKDLGSPIRGRSLYPSNLTAFGPERTEGYFTARRNDVLARASKEKRYGLQDTASRLNLLLRQTIDFLKRTAHQDMPIDLIRSILKFIKETRLHDLRPQLVNLSKLLVYLKDTPSFEDKYKPKARSRTEGESTKSVVGGGKVQGSGSIASRFGIKTPQIPQMPQISASKLKARGLQSLYGKKSAPEEPEPAKDSSNTAPTTQRPVTTVQEQVEPETLVDEINDWISTKRDVKNIPDEFKDLFENLQAPNLDRLRIGRQKPKTTKTPLSNSMICPNPIMVTTSGIEGVFDIQRVVITMQNPEALRYQVESVVNQSQKISGQCTISTALSTITVNFSCAAGVLRKQLDVCDVVQQALFEVELEKGGGSTQTDLPLAPGQENTNYYGKLASLSSGFMRQKSQPTGAPENENSKHDTQGEEAQTQAFGETEEQRRVCRMLDFVQETNINFIVGEWVLARFTGAEGAKWFLCQLELGSTHSYYGRRIATDQIDFENVVPEFGLVGHWENYMENKKTELCRVMNVLIRGRIARRYADEVVGPEKEIDKAAQINAEIDEDSDSGGSDGKEKLIGILVKRGTLFGAEIVQTVTDMWGERLDGMLSDTILQQVPKELRAAILNLNENEDLLPAMFLSGVKVHMF